jgi:restriction system protein
LRRHIGQCNLLNQQVRDWNSKSRLEWETYVRQSKLWSDEEVAEFALVSKVYGSKCQEQKSHFKAILKGYKERQKTNVMDRFNYVLGNLSLPRSLPQSWDIDFDEEQQILIIEIGLPDVVHQPPFKRVLLKSGFVIKPLNQTERKEIIPKVHPAIVLRLAYEVFRNDDAEVVKLLVLNGWVKFDDPSTGIDTKAYTASLMVDRNQISNVNLSKIDPVAAFDSLHGKSAGRLIEIIPIEPMLSLNKKDSRFVDAKAVLSTLGSATNLAAMDWQDFEHLIRELFEKEFTGRGAEVKITQASRDRGVDAIVFDPDPIHGGKYVIQAKRYTNTVDVSAVRDLCAVVKKEGASRGILVTTSTYGADAYAFANNEPVSLLNGAELLGLLRKHGYSFRINLQEARKLGQMNPYKEKNSATP